MNQQREHNDSLDLIQRYFAGQFDESAETAFWRAVAADEEFARQVTAYSMFESQLIERTGSTSTQRESVEPARSARFSFPIAGLALAAAVLIVAAVVAVYFVVGGANDPVEVPQGPPIATLISASGSVVVDGSMARGGQQYPAGTISMDSGSAEFQLRNGASVRLRGQTRITVLNGMNAAMMRGVATIRCPPSAVGYAVHLPGGARVVDLGTAFTVWVDADGRSYIYMHEGSVELHTIGGKTQTLTGRGAWSAGEDGLDAGSIDPADAPDVVAFDPEWVEPDGADYAAAVIADDPIAYWRFDRAFDGRVLDQTGNEHDARFVGSAFIDEGMLAQAVRPSDTKTAGSVECDAMLRLMVTDVYTVECWARADKVHTGAIFSLGDAVLLEFQSANSRGRTEPSLRYLHREVGPSSGGEDLYHPYEANRWIHIAAVKTPTDMTLYVDGEPVATAEITAPLFDNAPTFALGRLSSKPLGDGWSRPLRGSIDEVAVYRAALSAQQIKIHYEAARRAEDEPENLSTENPLSGDAS